MGKAIDSIYFNGLLCFITEKSSASLGAISATSGKFGVGSGFFQRRFGHSNCRKRHDPGVAEPWCDMHGVSQRYDWCVAAGVCDNPPVS